MPPLVEATPLVDPPLLVAPPVVVPLPVVPTVPVLPVAAATVLGWRCTAAVVALYSDPLEQPRLEATAAMVRIPRTLSIKKRAGNLADPTFPSWLN